MTSQTRNAHLQLADRRAMEEQMERENPVNPKKLLGAGATPSIGLSQFRGGKSLSRRQEKKAVSDSDAEAIAMGQALGNHLHNLHGGSFHRAFCNGMMDGGRRILGEDEQEAQSQHYAQMKERQDKNVKEGRAPLHDAGDEDFGLTRDEIQAKMNEKFKRENPIKHFIGDYGMKAVKGARDLAIEHGSKVNLPAPLIEALKYSKELTGEGKTGAYEGKGRKKRAPASAGDGRRKRAEVVKRVMAEKGMKMIEASKYVKQHGLY